MHGRFVVCNGSCTSECMQIMSEGPCVPLRAALSAHGIVAAEPPSTAVSQSWASSCMHACLSCSHLLLVRHSLLITAEIHALISCCAVHSAVRLAWPAPHSMTAPRHQPTRPVDAMPTCCCAWRRACVPYISIGTPAPQPPAPSRPATHLQKKLRGRLIRPSKLSSFQPCDAYRSSACPVLRLCTAQLPPCNFGGLMFFLCAGSPSSTTSLGPTSDTIPCRLLRSTHT
jgi:hypothetical protein